MLLCLDVGNSQILGGVYEGESLRCTFPYALEGLLRREIEAAGGKLADVQHGEQVTLAFTLVATAADPLLLRLNESGQGRIIWWPEDEG